MLKISEAASIGLHTMAFLVAYPEKLIPTWEIAQRLAVSEAHLAKVLQRLTKAGLVESIRGPHGGVKLDVKPKDVSLLEVYEAIEGPIPVSKCLFNTAICDEKNCIFGNMLNNVNKEVLSYLSKTKLIHLNAIVGRTHV